MGRNNREIFLVERDEFQKFHDTSPLFCPNPSKVGFGRRIYKVSRTNVSRGMRNFSLGYRARRCVKTAPFGHETPSGVIGCGAQFDALVRGEDVPDAIDAIALRLIDDARAPPLHRRNGDQRQRGPYSSSRETKMHDVAVCNNIVLAFQTKLASVTGAGLAAERCVISVGNGFGPDEAALEIGVDDACRLLRA